MRDRAAAVALGRVDSTRPASRPPQGGARCGCPSPRPVLGRDRQDHRVSGRSPGAPGPGARGTDSPRHRDVRIGDIPAPLGPHRRRGRSTSSQHEAVCRGADRRGVSARYPSRRTGRSGGAPALQVGSRRGKQPGRWWGKPIPLREAGAGPQVCRAGARYCERTGGTRITWRFGRGPAEGLGRSGCRSTTATDGMIMDQRWGALNDSRLPLKHWRTGPRPRDACRRPAFGRSRCAWRAVSTTRRGSGTRWPVGSPAMSAYRWRTDGAPAMSDRG